VSSDPRCDDSSTSCHVERSSERRSIDIGRCRTILEPMIVWHRPMDRWASVNDRDRRAMDRSAPVNDRDPCAEDRSRSSNLDDPRAGGSFDVEQRSRFSRRWIDRHR
jgi:hypothetical protein